MVSWNKSLDRKSFALFDIPKSIKESGYFQDGSEYLFKITAGKFVVQQVLKVTSGLEVSVPKDIQGALIDVSEKGVLLAEFQWNDASLIFDEFDEAVKESLTSTSAKRRKRLSKAKKMPASRTTSTTVFIRNPDVVAEVLERADGKCEACKEDAPFLRKSDGRPYLEVHHIKQLAMGGEDTVNNAEALCPNCHRRRHFG